MMWKMYQFWILCILSMLSWSMVATVYHNVSPLESPDIAFPLFYLSFILASLFTLAIIFSLLWKAILPVKSSYICIKNGIREGVIGSVAMGIFLFLLQFGVFGIIPFIIILGLAIVIELFFLF